jgi:hypothetical protein
MGLTRHFALVKDKLLRILLFSAELIQTLKFLNNAPESWGSGGFPLERAPPAG